MNKQETIKFLQEHFFEEDERANIIADFIFENFEEKKKHNFDWFDEWYELFPAGVKSGSKLVRSDKIGTAKKMLRFLKIYTYTKEQIIEATKQYVEEFAENDYKYMKCATYFIDKKDEGSELAARCENLNYSLPKEKVTNTNFFL